MADHYQLTTNTQAAADIWTQGNQNGQQQAMMPYVPSASGYTGGPSAGGPVRVSPMKKAHRLLRGRYPMAITLAAIGAVVGAAAGWMAMPPKFESTGSVLVNSTITTTGPNDPILPMLAMFIQNQTGFLQSIPVAELARQNKDFVDAWQKNYSAPVPTATDFIAQTTVEHIKNGGIINVAFDDRKADVAEAGCHALLASYMQLYGNGDQSQDEKKMKWLRNDLNTQEATLRLKRKELDALSEKYGTADLASRDQIVQQQLATLDALLVQAETAYETAKEIQEGHKASQAPVDKEYLDQQIANVDPMMAHDLHALEHDQEVLDIVAQQGVGPKHPQYILAQSNIVSAQRQVDNDRRDYMTRHPGALQQFGAGDDAGMGQSLEILKQRADSLKKQFDQEKLEASEIGSQRQQIDDTRTQLVQIQNTIDRDMQNIDGLSVRETLNETIVLADPGSKAQLSTNKRALVAGLGFGFGGFIPLGLMMLYGLTENRFRYSDEASAADLAGVTLLGILPNLPDRLSDPQQAGIAAHCVHQIRTMLQISTPSDEPQVIAVTSASSGDGKTSLTLALGLSYAAAGVRTLLIDCDLVAAGLTHRLNVNSPDGVLESVANRALLEYVRTTDIADVAILPVGTTHAHHASTLSPVALRRLLSESKKHFDIIIVDTGPILGSIEASLVCAASDRTVLAVARNQQRPLVEKSISHLMSIGSNLAGVVFNRAHTKDFERSMSGLALRSRPAAATGSQGASAAKAVAGSFKRAG